MKHLNIAVNFIIFSLFLAIPATAHDSESREVEREYECANKYYRYRLDNEPAEYGFLAGEYAPGKRAYIGLSAFGTIAFQINRLQLDPPGVQLFNCAGPGSFANDTHRIWYLARNRRHHYKWVNSSGARSEPFAIEVGSDLILYIGRIQKGNVVMLGTVVPRAGVMYYADENGISRSTRSGYQVLTCRSDRNETKIAPPSLKAVIPPPVDSPTGCVNKWLRYSNDDAPTRNGVSAGSHGCGNPAFVGKAIKYGAFTPGRIQTTSLAGLYISDRGSETLMTSGAFYLADNANYTYSWAVADGSVPSNAVYLDTVEVGRFSVPITRVKLNGKTNVGSLSYPVSNILNEKGIGEFLDSFEILVCDPWPRYLCNQEWKKFDVADSASGPAVDGFNLGTFTGNITSFIGRSLQSDCSFGLGRAQADPPAQAGVYSLDDLTSAEVFDNSSVTAEYLVRNPRYTYKWVPSRNGVRVPNALAVRKEAQKSFYIGVMRINDVVFVGKVRPGQGLFFVDLDNGLKTVSSYSVLTCTSPDAENGVYEEESDADWHAEHWCGENRVWSYSKSRCVSRK